MKKNTLIYLVAILAIVGVIYSFFAFDKAFPIVNVKITADKNIVSAKADSISRELGLMPAGYRSVVGFDTDNQFKNYVELEGGGVEVFQRIVDEGIYDPYYWMVRQYNNNEITECQYFFKPNGDFLGFKLSVPDSLPGEDISDPNIAALLKKDPRSALVPDLSNYSLIEKSSELKESGRRDHVFTYEMNDAGVGEALYRIKIKVSGDKITMVVPIVKIPDAFDQRYEEMRSANTTISAVGQAVMLILYGILGLGLSLFFMIRKRDLNWKPALKWALIIGGMIFLAYLTTIALSWFSYDTSYSSGQFLFQRIFAAILNGLLIAVIFFVSSLGAENLDRRAFPKHIQLWRNWSPTVGASKEVMRHTVFGYLWALFMVGFITLFYWISNHLFGWWSPAENMVDPNVLALPMPWLLPAAQSLQAGFWEEVLFRAVPIAGAVLIAKKFKRKGIWIAFVLLLQAVIFGSLHANYAQQPAYARIVEMIIPFVIYGLIYMNWGLLPVIISHFVYDIVLMAMPLFIMSAPGIWIHRLLAVIAMLIPLGIVITRRIKAGSWYELQSADLNEGYKVPDIDHVEDQSKEKISPLVRHRELPIFVAIILLVAGAALWIVFTPFEQDIPKLRIGRDQAIEIADQFIAEHYPQTDTLGYKPYVKLSSGIGRGGRFAWEYGGKELFRELYKTVLSSNYFVVTYKTFEGDVVTRSETVDVSVGRDGQILSWYHNVPEPYEGAALEEEKARQIAEKAIEDQYEIDINDLEPVKITPEKRKARTDWTIIYRDVNTGLEEGDVRYLVSISGDEISGMETMVHTTETWDRSQKKEGMLKTILLVISKLIEFGMLITVLIFGIIAWSRKQFNVRLFVYFALGLGLLSILQSLLMANSIIGQYPTSEPFTNMMLMLAVGILLGTLFSSFLYAVPIGYMARLPLQVQRNEPVIGIKGTGLGLILAAGIAFAQGYILKNMPQALPAFQTGTAHPLIMSFLTAIETYFVTFVKLMVPFVIAEKLSVSWQKRKVITIILLFLAGFAYVGKLPLTLWLVGGSAVGMLMILLYIWVLRYNVIYIPVMTAVLLILDMVRYLMADPSLLTVPHVIMNIILNILLAVFTVWGVYRVRMLQPKNSSQKPEVRS
jgi:membrane protease YdiL (CAAX protease family)